TYPSRQTISILAILAKIITFVGTKYFDLYQ
ncbi:MAG: hypothetical protein ACI9VL_001365, partial [Colwellia sp.]